METAVVIPAAPTTVPKGANPSESKRELSLKLMKSNVVRVFGPAAAKLTVPIVLLIFTGSSGILPARCSSVHRLRRTERRALLTLCARTCRPASCWTRLPIAPQSSEHTG